MSAKEILINVFGYSEFRQGQEEIIESILNGNNVLTIFPTGGGKSLCYQIPALASESFSLVISPLIALMKDQVDGLNKQKQIAAYINSSLDYLAAEKVLNNIKNGEIKLLYVSPEKLDNISFAERIKNLAPKYVFVDEAHCISEWGHNFRPSYRRIKEFCEFINNDSISAFTATAIPEVRRDIIEHLNFKNPRIFIKGFERENLFLNVIKTHQKKETTLELIRKYDSPAVIYTATRKGAEDISEFLNMNGFVSSYYHAGLPPEQRRIIQDDFMQDRIKIISATNAFGMGVDKPDIRLLIHYNMPGTIENYYQEIGRAGRDDIDSKIFLLYEEKDLSIQEFFINNNYPSRNDIELVYNKICDSAQLAVGSIFEKDIPLNNILIKSLSQQRINKQKVLSVVKLLEEHGYLKFKNDSHSNHYVKILFSKNDLRTYIDKFARKSLKDVLLLLIREYGNSILNHKTKINLKKIATSVNESIEFVKKTLTKLSYAGVLDYDEPVEADAIQILGTRVASHNLSISTDHWLKLKQHAYDKLQFMRKYSFSSECRFSIILNYFGEEATDYRCGKCDNCRGNTKEDQLTLEYLEEIILNTLHEAGGNFKINDIIKTLLGTGKHPGLKNLSNYGVCKHFKKEDINKSIDSIETKGIIKRFENRITLTDLGKNKLTLVPDKSIGQVNINDNYERRLILYNKLREIRKAAARKFSQQVNLICSDEILKRIVDNEPTTPSGLISIEGFSQWMFNKVGDEFLEILNEHQKEFEFEDNIKNKNFPEGIKQTYELIKRGYSLEDIASLSKLPEAVVSLQIESIIEFAPDLEISSLIKQTEFDLIHSEIKKGATNLKELKQKLPSFISYGKIRIILKKYNVS